MKKSKENVTVLNIYIINIANQPLHNHAQSQCHSNAPLSGHCDCLPSELVSLFSHLICTFYLLSRESYRYRHALHACRKACPCVMCGRLYSAQKLKHAVEWSMMVCNLSTHRQTCVEMHLRLKLAPPCASYTI